VLVWRVVKVCYGRDPKTRGILAADVVGFSRLAGAPARLRYEPASRKSSGSIRAESAVEPGACVIGSIRQNGPSWLPAMSAVR
jgi:hypothetical protein